MSEAAGSRQSHRFHSSQNPCLCQAHALQLSVQSRLSCVFLIENCIIFPLSPHRSDISSSEAASRHQIGDPPSKRVGDAAASDENAPPAGSTTIEEDEAGEKNAPGIGADGNASADQTGTEGTRLEGTGKGDTTRAEGDSGTANDSSEQKESSPRQEGPKGAEKESAERPPSAAATRRKPPAQSDAWTAWRASLASSMLTQDRFKLETLVMGLFWAALAVVCATGCLSFLRMPALLKNDLGVFGEWQRVRGQTTRALVPLALTLHGRSRSATWFDPPSISAAVMMALS